MSPSTYLLPLVQQRLHHHLRVPGPRRTLPRQVHLRLGRLTLRPDLHYSTYPHDPHAMQDPLAAGWRVGGRGGEELEITFLLLLGGETRGEADRRSPLQQRLSNPSSPPATAALRSVTAMAAGRLRFEKGKKADVDFSFSFQGKWLAELELGRGGQVLLGSVWAQSTDPKSVYFSFF
jgi:hypothetical protein